MENSFKKLRKGIRIWTARCLILVMLIISATIRNTTGVSASQAIPEFSGSSLPAEYLPGQKDLWETAEQNNEVMVAFPSQIESDISSPDDEDRYSFHLEGTGDLTVSLESEYPCTMELLHHGQVIGTSNRPYSQLLEPDGLEAGTYTVRITPQENVKTSSYVLRIFRQTDRDTQPDYSEAHIAGTLFDPVSPFRALNIKNEEEKNRGGSPIMAIHYLAHWQGPVDESVVPYYDKGDYLETPSNYIKYKKAEPEFHVQNAILLPGYQENGDHIEHWKNAIMTYGAIDTGLYNSLNYRDKNEGPGFPDLDWEYLYVPKDWIYDRLGGHATLIVGWDDTVAKENFRVTRRDKAGNIIAETMPEQDGAWICKDSYGGLLPDYYFVSYESEDFGTSAFTPTAFAPAEQRDNYNHLYSNVSSGMTDVATASTGFLRGVSVFQNEGQSELLRAVGFFAGQGEISYEIGIRIDDGPLERVQSGYLKYPGFYTARLNQGIMIPPGSDFEIHVALSGDEDQWISFYSCQNTKGWIDGVKAIPGKAYYYTDWDGESEWFDASAQGEYPYICAYTYSPVKQEITLLDNKEPAGKLEKATDSNAEKKREKASSSNADKEIASSSNADKETASSSDAKRKNEARTAPSPDENGETKRSLWRIKNEDSGAIPYEDAQDIEVQPLDLSFPARYDSRDYHLITKVKNQGNSSICWAFAAAGALEASYLRYGNLMIDYPRGLNITSQEVISDGVISLKLRKGEEIPLKLTASLNSDSEHFNPGTPQIYWEISGDLGSVEEGQQISESGEETSVLKALAPGRVTVTAVSMADVSLKTSCQVEITENVPASVHIEPEKLQMKVGEVRNLTTTVEAEEELAVVYTSDRPDVVSVDKNGQVIALSTGTAVITAKAGEGEAHCTITVSGRNHSDDENDNGYTVSVPDAENTVRGTWEQTGAQWRFLKDDGSYAVSAWERIKGIWYYFKEDTYAASGWFRQGDSWYYLSQEAETYGGMQTGWLFDPAYQGWFYLDESGSMAVGWRQVCGAWYYFNAVSDGEMGKMYASETTPDGYAVGADGEWIME